MTSERTETLVSGPAEGLAGLLGVDLPDLASEGLPPLWHWVYLLDRPAQQDLGQDGHPFRGVVALPPGPGLRRMWAGGLVRTLGPLLLEQPATRTSFVARSEDKQGRSGPMTFLTVRHEVRQAGRLVIEEEQHIVYRQPPPASPSAVRDEPAEQVPEKPAPEQLAPEAPLAGDAWMIEVTPTLLARFSALTYNGHRIHYDRDFAVDVEGYPGLLVHGPLQAVAMAEAARRLVGAVVPIEFDYRLLSPLFDHEGMVVWARVEGGAWVTGVRDRWGRHTAQGRLILGKPTPSEHDTPPG